MFVYLVIHGIQYEGESVCGVFSDYAKALEFEKIITDSFGYTQIRKVEVDKRYESVFQGIGEEV